MGTPPYAVVVDRVSALLAGADDEVAARPVPACPRWTVRQTLAHLVGVPADILAGNLERAGRDEWTQAQVDARADRTIAELLAEWARTGPQVAPGLVGPLGGQPVFDAVTHELDLRGALGLPAEADADVLAEALRWLVPNFGRAVVRRGSPALQLVADSGSWLCGEGEPAGVLAGSNVDVLRSISGRRTKEQVAALLTTQHPDGIEAWWPAFRWGPFTPPASPADTPDR